MNFEKEINTVNHTQLNNLTMLKVCLDEFRKAPNVFITSHLNPDGDAIGCELAIARWLKSEGKEVQICNSSFTPSMYTFLDSHKEIQHFESKTPPQIPQNALVCIVDVGVWDRLGAISEWLKTTSNRKICIDHHQSNHEIAHINWVDASAAATGELIYQLLVHAGVEITENIALPLYTAIVIDTGSFRFANTRPLSHQIAAALLKTGVKPHLVESALNERNSWGKMWITGRALANLGKAANGRIAWVKVTNKLLEETGASVDDTEGLVEQLRTIEGVQIGILFREMNPKRTKLSFRSKGVHDMSRLAEQFGGGGHIGAAGAVVDESIDSILPKILKVAERMLDTL